MGPSATELQELAYHRPVLAAILLGGAPVLNTLWGLESRLSHLVALELDDSQRLLPFLSAYCSIHLQSWHSSIRLRPQSPSTTEAFYLGGVRARHGYLRGSICLPVHSQYGSYFVLFVSKSRTDETDLIGQSQLDISCLEWEMNLKSAQITL